MITGQHIAVELDIKLPIPFVKQQSKGKISSANGKIGKISSANVYLIHRIALAALYLP